MVADELEGYAVQLRDREPVALGEVDLDHLDPLVFSTLTTYGEPAFMITLPGSRVTTLTREVPVLLRGHLDDFDVVPSQLTVKPALTRCGARARTHRCPEP